MYHSLVRFEQAIKDYPILAKINPSKDLFKVYITNIKEDISQVPFIKSGILDLCIQDNSLCKDVVDAFSLDISLQFMSNWYKEQLDSFLPKNKQLFLDFISRNQILVADILNYINSKITRICRLEKLFPGFLYPDCISDSHFIFTLDEGHIKLALLCVNNLMTIDQVKAIDVNSTSYLIYEDYCQKLNKDAKVYDNFTKLQDFCNSTYLQFLEKDIFTPMHTELGRLIDEYPSAKYGRGYGKIAIVAGYIKEISTKIVKIVGVNTTSKSQKNDPSIRIHKFLTTKFSKIVNDASLKKHDSQICAFFKGLLGVLLAACLLFLPLFSQGYRNTFFPDTKEISQMKDLQASVEKENSLAS
ncbi:MAG: hypothetical protein P1U74_08675 [Legionellaceae bacterium]|nr:hypothetical protein [Legionellaceae bacterium]